MAFRKLWGLLRNASCVFMCRDSSARTVPGQHADCAFGPDRACRLRNRHARHPGRVSPCETLGRSCNRPWDDGDAKHSFLMILLSWSDVRFDGRYHHEIRVRAFSRRKWPAWGGALEESQRQGRMLRGKATPVGGRQTCGDAAAAAEGARPVNVEENVPYRAHFLPR